MLKSTSIYRALLLATLTTTAAAQAATIPAATGASVTSNGGSGLNPGSDLTVLTKTIIVDPDKAGLYDLNAQMTLHNGSTFLLGNSRIYVDDIPMRPASGSVAPSKFLNLVSPAQVYLTPGSHKLELKYNGNSAAGLGAATLTATGYNTAAGIPAATGSTVTTSTLSIPAGNNVFATVLSQNINVDANKTGLYNIKSHVNYYNQVNSPYIAGRLLIDGVAQPLLITNTPSPLTSSNNWGTIAIPAQVTLSPGPHTVALQLATANTTVDNLPIINSELSLTGFNSILGTPAATGTTASLANPLTIAMNGSHQTVLSKSITVDAGKTGLFDIDTQLTYLSDFDLNTCFGFLFIDGQQVNSAASYANNGSFGNLIVPAQVTLSPGNHTIELKMSTTNADPTQYIPTASINITGYNQIPIPEPTTLALTLPAALLTLTRRRRQN